MATLEEISRRLTDLERRLSALVRVGVVSEVDRTKCRVRVTFPRAVSGWLPVLVKQSTITREVWLPDLEAQVLCVFLPVSVEVGFVVGSFYSDKDPLPEGAEAEGLQMIEFGDGARFEYDSENSLFRVLVGETRIEVTPDGIALAGPSGLQPFVKGDDLVTLIKAHTHPTGVGPSGPPTNAASFDSVKSTKIKGA